MRYPETSPGSRRMPIAWSTRSGIEGSRRLRSSIGGRVQARDRGRRECVGPHVDDGIRPAEPTGDLWRQHALPALRLLPVPRHQRAGVAEQPHHAHRRSGLAGLGLGDHVESAAQGVPGLLLSRAGRVHHSRRSPGSAAGVPDLRRGRHTAGDSDPPLRARLFGAPVPPRHSVRTVTGLTTERAPTPSPNGASGKSASGQHAP